MTVLLETTGSGKNLSVTGSPLLAQTGYVNEALAVQFYNSSETDDSDKCGGSQADWTTLESIPDGGFCIEIVMKLSSTNDLASTACANGHMLFSLNGSGISGYHFGTMTLGICDYTGSPASGTGNELFIRQDSACSDFMLALDSSLVGTTTTENIVYGSSLADDTFHIIHLNISYSASNLSGSTLPFDTELFLDGTSIGTHSFASSVNIKTDGTLALGRINIGGWTYETGSETAYLDATASFPGLIDQVVFYDALLSSTDISTIATNYGFPI